MSASGFSSAFTVRAGPNNTGRLVDGSCDGLYWVRGQVNGGNEWRGPFPTSAGADLAARALLDLLYSSGLSFNSLCWVEWGKRYWRPNDGGYNGGKWLLMAEQAYASVQDLPPMYDEDVVPPPLAGIRFGIISTREEYGNGRSKRGASLPSQNTIYAQGGGLVRGTSALSIDDVKLLGLFWREAATSYPPFTNVPTVVGPSLRQSQIFLDRLVFSGAGNWINIFVPRPVIDLPDDDGTDGNFLAGYRIQPVSINRTCQQVTQLTSKSQPLTANYSPTTSGDMGSVTFLPAPGVPGAGVFYQFDRIESVLLSTDGRQLSGNQPTGPGFMGADVSGGGGAFPSLPSAVFSPHNIASFTRICQTKYSLQAVTVTRTGGAASYTYGAPTEKEIAYIPATMEPPPVEADYIIRPPLDLGSEGVYPGRDLMYKGGGKLYQIGTNSPLSPLHLVLDAFPAILPNGIDYQWSEVPGAAGYTVVEYWGSPSVKKDFFYIDIKNVPGSFARSHVWGQYFTAPQLRAAGFGAPDGNYSGGFNGAFGPVLIYPNIPAFINGGSCNYGIPNGNGSYNDFGRACCGGDLEGMIAYKVTPVPDPNPNSSWAAIPTEPPPLYTKLSVYDYYPGGVFPVGLDPEPPGGFLYNWHTIALWRAPKGTTAPNFDRAGVSFQADMSDGSIGYWRLGDQSGAPSIPGADIWGYDLAFTGADGTITYTKPVYIPGPRQYFTDVAVDISTDNLTAPPSVKFKHLLLLEPDPPIGIAIVNYLDLNSTGGQIAQATVTFYDRPQKFIPGVQL